MEGDMPIDRNVAEYSIDLGRSEGDRWAEVIRTEGDRTGALASKALEEAKLPAWLSGAAALAFKGLYDVVGGPYRGEIAAWAQGMQLPIGVVMLLNCAYELSYKFGCTAGIHKLSEGIAHVRNLDWEIPGLGSTTRLFHFHRNGNHEFTTVGFPGFVGALSGMRPHAYSVTINWAPSGQWPNPQAYGPAMVLRMVLEQAPTFDAAVERLRNTQLAAGAFFTVCGAQDGQGCVIERTQQAHVVRPWNTPTRPLVQANHYVDAAFADNNAEL